MANVKITDLTAATALGGSELFECVQSSTSVKASATQIKTFIGSSLNVTGGVINSVTINNAVGEFDSITITNGTISSVTISSSSFSSGTISNTTGSFNSITVTAGTIPYTAITGKVYGFFSSNRDQTYSSNVNSVLSLDTSADFNTGVSLASSSQITFAAAGVYEINAAIQFANSDTNDHDVTIWFRRNGTDLVGSASKVTVPKAADGGAALLSISGIESFSISGYIECVANFESSLVIASYDAAVVGPPAIPSTPSVRISAKRVGL